MRYITSIERFATKKRRLQPVRENVIEIMEVRFETLTKSISYIINNISGASVVKSIHNHEQNCF